MVDKEIDQQYGIDIVAAFAERTVKRLWITIILLVVLLFGSNAAWIYYESQFATEVQEVTQDVDTGEGDAIVTGIGDIYGEGSADNTEENENP